MNTYGFLGASEIGVAMAALLANSGVSTLITDRAGSEVLTERHGAATLTFATPSKLLSAADVLVLCLPFAEALNLATRFPAFAAGRVVVDATNPWRMDARDREITPSTSSSLDLARALPYVRMAKAFNCLQLVSGRILMNQVVPIAADDIIAVDAASTIALQVGLRPVHVGPLALAPAIESKALIDAALARQIRSQTDWENDEA